MTWSEWAAQGRDLRATYDDEDAAGPGESVRVAGAIAWPGRLRRVCAEALGSGAVGRGIALGALAAAILGLTIAVSVAGIGSPIVDRPAVYVSLRACLCLGLLAMGIVIAVRGGSGRMAGLLLAAAGWGAVTGLTGVDSGGPFAIGRLAVPVTLLLIVYICLAYPSGRIEDQMARRVIAGSAAAIAALLSANLLLSAVPPVAGPFTRCSGTACPVNPLHVAALAPGAARALSTALALVTALTMAATPWLMGRRSGQSTPLQRHSLAPLMTWAVVAATGYGFFIAVRALDSSERWLDALAVAVVAVIALMPAALAYTVARGRLFAMTAVERVIARPKTEGSLRGIQEAMAQAFGDPRLLVLLWSPSDRRYVDLDERPVEVSEIGPERRVTPVGRNGEELAAVVHDPLLPADALDAAGSALRLALENSRLHMTLSASIRALEASRQRVAHAADEERRRIERDLHDGAQQGLIALRIRLQLLEDLATTDPRAVAPALRDAGRRVQAALDDIRDLAHGIYPSTLGDLGLTYALADVTRKLPARVVLRSKLERRFATDVETAVYFCCVEALQNVAKHCRAETRAELCLYERDDRLHFVLRDLGPGFDAAAAATSHGIAGMRDRLEAVGGRLAIDSRSGQGTCVAGWVPVEP